MHSLFGQEEASPGNSRLLRPATECDTAASASIWHQQLDTTQTNSAKGMGTHRWWDYTVDRDRPHMWAPKAKDFQIVSRNKFGCSRMLWKRSVMDLELKFLGITLILLSPVPRTCYFITAFGQILFVGCNFQTCELRTWWWHLFRLFFWDDIRNSMRQFWDWSQNVHLLGPSNLRGLTSQLTS